MSAPNLGCSQGRAAHTAADWLPQLVDQALTAQGVPAQHGGAGTSVTVAAEAVKAVMDRHPAAGLVLASQHATLQLLLLSRNVALREHWVPQLVAGEVFGIWPGAAMEALVERNHASVGAHDTGRGMRLNGPLGGIILPGHTRYLLACPVSWEPERPPGLALLDGDQNGIGLSSPYVLATGLSSAVAVLEHVFFRDDEWLDGDASSLAMRVAQGPLRSPLLKLTQGCGQWL